MSVTLNGSTGYLEWNKGAGSLPVTSFPFSIAVRFRSPTSGSNQFIAGIQQSNADTWLEAWADGNGTTVYSSARVAGSGTAASASGTYGTMKLLIVTFTATATSVAYGSSTFNTGAAPVSNPLGTCDRIVIGARHNSSGPDLFLNGDVAEVHFFNRELVSADFTTLNGDYTPESISGWVDGWSLKTNSDLVSIGGTRTLTLNGGVTSTGSHPITRSSGNATANGVTMTDTASLIAGSASGVRNPTQAGVTNTATASLIAGSASGVVNGTLTIPVVNNTDTSQTSITIPHVVVHKLTDRVEKFNAASQPTDSSGNLILVSSNFTPGQDYIATGWNSDGSQAFILKVTAT